MSVRTQSGELRSAILWMLLAACVFACACVSNEAGTAATAPPVTKDESCRNIERVIGTELPVSATGCKYYFRPIGWGGGRMFAYVELPHAEALALLDRSEKLPDACELRPAPGRWDPWHATDKDGAIVPGWQPLQLQDGQLADKHASDWSWAISICLGRTDTGRTGLCISYAVD